MAPRLGRRVIGEEWTKEDVLKSVMFVTIVVMCVKQSVIMELTKENSVEKNVLSF